MKNLEIIYKITLIFLKKIALCGSLGSICAFLAHSLSLKISSSKAGRMVSSLLKNKIILKSIN